VTRLIKNGRLLDPASQTDALRDILIDQGRVAAISEPGKSGASAKVDTFDATGMWVTPGLVDIHVHLREPGQEYKEDIESGSRAAAAGGFTTIVAMPNTKPVIDNEELVRYVLERGRAVGLCRVLPSGAITNGQKGEGLAPTAEMKRGGAVALTDDGHWVSNPALMRHALEYARDWQMPVLTHAEEPRLTGSGVMHEGVVSTLLGLHGITRVSEDAAVARDIMLAEYVGGWLHVCHVSTAGAVELIRQAKKRGARVSGEAAPHHFCLTDRAVEGYRTDAKMKPPLREEGDRRAVIEGLLDGTLEAIATDHAPHSSIEKDVAFSDAAYGIIGLQTALPLSLDLWRNEGMDPLTLIDRMTHGPCRLLGLPYGRLEEGGPADIAVIDPEASWRFDPQQVLSKSSNSPFLGREMRGRAVLTLLEGRATHG